MENKFPDINLPVWMNKGEPLTLAHASKTWWERVRDWLMFPLAQIDVDTCDEQLLALLAYQRDVERFPGESLSLFRLRVKYAFVNAQDAGCIAGFARIFERLGIGKIQQLERQLQYEWDVILIRINDEQLSRDNTLMMRLVSQYGRTCRRYFFDVVSTSVTHAHSGNFSCLTEYSYARYIPQPMRVTLDPSVLYLAPGETRSAEVTVEPEDAEDKTWRIEEHDGVIFKATASDGQLVIAGESVGKGTAEVITNTRGLRAGLNINVLDCVCVTLRVVDKTEPLFYCSDSDGLLIDYGDGELSTEFTVINVDGVVLPPERVNNGELIKLRLLGSKTINFARANTHGSMTNKIHTLHYVSGYRESLYWAFAYQQIEQIDPGAFDHLTGLQNIGGIFKQCSQLKALPGGLFKGKTQLSIANEAFYLCSKLVNLPGDTFAGCTELQEANTLCRETALKQIEPGLFADCSKLKELGSAFRECRVMAGNIEEAFSATSYPGMARARYLFWNCQKVTGSGTGLMSKFPDDIDAINAFYNCLSLSDYKDLRISLFMARDASMSGDYVGGEE